MLPLQLADGWGNNQLLWKMSWIDSKQKLCLPDGGRCRRDGNLQSSLVHAIVGLWDYNNVMVGTNNSAKKLHLYLIDSTINMTLNISMLDLIVVSCFVSHGDQRFQSFLWLLQQWASWKICVAIPTKLRTRLSSTQTVHLDFQWRCSINHVGLLLLSTSLGCHTWHCT